MKYKTIEKKGIGIGLLKNNKILRHESIRLRIKNSKIKCVIFDLVVFFTSCFLLGVIYGHGFVFFLLRVEKLLINYSMKD